MWDLWKNQLGLVLVVVTCCCCQNGYKDTAVPAPSLAAKPSPTVSPETQPYIPDQFGKPIGDFLKNYVDDDRLVYLDYEIDKLKRFVTTESPSHRTEVEYAVLRRRGKVVAKFDSPLDGLAEVRFALVSFLGDSSKQLVVEQTSEKFWRYWIVSLQPTLRTIYDNGGYDLVYELSAADFNNDGRTEIVQNIGSFWYFDSLDNLYSPRPPMIFEYDSGRQTYLPANAHFEQVALNDIKERIAKSTELTEKADSAADGSRIKSAILDVMIRYLYCGKSVEAWNFYDQHYHLGDKKSLRETLIKTLSRDKLYQSVKARTSRS